MQCGQTAVFFFICYLQTIQKTVDFSFQAKVLLYDISLRNQDPVRAFHRSKPIDDYMRSMNKSKTTFDSSYDKENACTSMDAMDGLVQTESGDDRDGDDASTSMDAQGQQGKAV